MTMSDLAGLSTPLQIDQVEFRVQSINKGGYATILAYKDARCDMQRLDDVCGQLGWKREHSRDNHNCIVSIWDNEWNHWVGKEDTGTESMAESEKGLASDSFKRACFNWGIGRELYDYPLVQVKLKEEEHSNGKATWKLKIREWKWDSAFNDSGKLVMLEAKDTGGNIRFQFGVEFKELEKYWEELVTLLANKDTFGLRHFVNEQGKDSMEVLFNNAPKGHKTRFKDEVRELYQVGVNQVKGTVLSLQEAIEAGDGSAIEEIDAEMGTLEDSFVTAALTATEKHQIGTLLQQQLKVEATEYERT
jgi:hypothetical protein